MPSPAVKDADRRLPSRTLSDRPESTRMLAARWAALARAGDVWALHGGLGAGKTCFVQGLAEGLGITQRVQSPTYALMHEYDGGRLPLYHMDLYRVHDPEAALEAGLDEYLYGKGLTVIEWAERIVALLPAETVHITLEAGAMDDERIIRVSQGVTS